MKEARQTAQRNPAILFLSSIFGLLLLWWSILHFCIPTASSEALQLWGASYQVLAWFGAIIGFLYAERWGGIRSTLGRAMLAFSTGLVLQSFGQTVYSLYVYVFQIDIPYPSYGDIGFFGSIFFYVYGAFLLAKVAGAKTVLSSYSQQIIAVIVPVLLLGATYFFFLRGYVFDYSQPLTILLDFGYPLGQAIYFSMALLAYLLSRRVLGGVMKLPLLLFISALLLQYLSDFSFLYEAHKDTYYSGGIVDLMYTASYFLMALALIHAGSIFVKIRET